MDKISSTSELRSELERILKLASTERPSRQVLATEIRNVADRLIKADLPVGKTFYTEELRIHRYVNNLEVTETVNAGKRGKVCLRMSIMVQARQNEKEILDDVSKIITSLQTYDRVKLAVRDYMEANPSALTVTETVLKGVDVEPAGTKIELKTDTGLEIRSSPQDFSISHTAYYGSPQSVTKTHGQTTLYWPVKKQDGAVFYVWLKENLSRANKMTIQDLTETMHKLGVKYDSH